MSTRSQGRGVIAVIGLLVFLAGLVGGVVLWILAVREPDRVAERFARAAPGCTTTLNFAESGEYYVYEERSGATAPADGCEPSATPGQTFTVDVVAIGSGTVTSVDDTTVSYDLDAGTATSVARITIDQPGEYEISVLSDDPAVVAAVGGEPDANVARLRQGAIGAAAVGLVVGGLLLWMSARRSRRAATVERQADPGWAATVPEREWRATDPAQGGAPWPPAPPDVGRMPTEPHHPAAQPAARLEPPPPSGAPKPAPAASPWAPPTAGDPGPADGDDRDGRSDVSDADGDDRDRRSDPGADG